MTFIDILSKKKIYNEETIVFMFEILHSLCSFRMTGVLEVETGIRRQISDVAFIDRLKIYNEETMVFRFEILHSLRSFRMTGIREAETGERKQ